MPSQPITVNQRFLNPWPGANGMRPVSDVLRWQWQRFRNPPPSWAGTQAIPRAAPDVAYPQASPDDVRITWIGQSTFLIQLAGLNLLTDPVFSERASPLTWIGPARFLPPGLPLAALPPIHTILLSHDHYDHLDAASVRVLADQHPAALWLAPHGHAGFLRKHGVMAGQIRELSWWQQHAEHSGQLVFTALPAQHWTRRFGSAPNARLWCSWHIAGADCRVYFAGDSGYCPCFREIGAELGPSDVALLPIGAYEPRWFMKDAHMNPEEAVQAYIDLQARHFIGMHWGTFRLTDEDPLEPPERLRAAWLQRNLQPAHLHLSAIGETVRLMED